MCVTGSGSGFGVGLRLLLRAAVLGGLLGLAGPVALALDGDDVGVVDDAIDEGGGARRVGEDGGPVAEGEIRGEDEALLLIATADDLEEEVGRFGCRRREIRFRPR
jgi:hypothetical protein